MVSAAVIALGLTACSVDPDDADWNAGLNTTPEITAHLKRFPQCKHRNQAEGNLWSNVGTALRGAPVTYSIGTKQYVAVQASGRHLHPVKFDNLQDSSYLFVFALN